MIKKKYLSPLSSAFISYFFSLYLPIKRFALIVFPPFFYYSPSLSFLFRTLIFCKTPKDTEREKRLSVVAFGIFVLVFSKTESREKMINIKGKLLQQEYFSTLPKFFRTFSPSEKNSKKATHS